MAKVGRKSAIEEFKDGALLGMTTQWLISNFYKLSESDKLRVALAIAPKGISDKHEHSGKFQVDFLQQAIKKSEEVYDHLGRG